MAKKEWVSITEAAEIANVSRQTIFRRCGGDGYEKEFESAVLVGSAGWAIEKSEVIRYGEYYHSTEFEDEEVE